MGNKNPVCIYSTLGIGGYGQIHGFLFVGKEVIEGNKVFVRGVGSWRAEQGAEEARDGCSPSCMGHSVESNLEYTLTPHLRRAMDFDKEVVIPEMREVLTGTGEARVIKNVRRVEDKRMAKRFIAGYS